MDIYPEWAQTVSHVQMAAAVQTERISKGQQVQKRHTETCQKRFEHTSAAAVESSRARGLTLHNKNSVGTCIHCELQSPSQGLPINPQRLIQKSDTTKRSLGKMTWKDLFHSTLIGATLSQLCSICI